MQLEKNAKEEEKECYLKAKPVLDLPLLPVNMEKSPNFISFRFHVYQGELWYLFYQLFFFFFEIMFEKMLEKQSLL